MTTEQCLLNKNRNPHLGKKEIENFLNNYLGVNNFIWLKCGILGDDTDGHIDDLARFVAPGVVVACAEDDPHDPNHAALADNLRRLRGARDAAGKPLEVAPLPMPPPLHWRGERCPASYVNFYLANGAALVPVFGAAQDARALAVLGVFIVKIEEIPITVVKRDGSTELFHPEKLLRGLTRACTKRRVPVERLQGVVNDIERELREEAAYDVSSERVGKMALERLRQIDLVAYVRFASVYRQFESVEEFKRELEQLGKEGIR